MLTTRWMAATLLIAALASGCRSSKASEDDEPPGPDPEDVVETRDVAEAEDVQEVEDTTGSPPDTTIAEDTAASEDTSPPPDVDGYARVPAGRARIGDNTCGDGCGRIRMDPEGEVEISYDYMVKTHKVTIVEWNRLFPERPLTGDPQAAAEVPWWDAVMYCDRLSVAEGLEPCYGIEGQCAEYQRWQWGVEPQSPCNPYGDMTLGDALECEGYRIPTEAEWDLAMRAGRPTDDLRELARTGWATHPDNLPPDWDINAFGLSGMFSYPGEWVWDRRHYVYTYDNDGVDPLWSAPDLPAGRLTQYRWGIAMHTILFDMLNVNAFRPARRVWR